MIMNSKQIAWSLVGEINGLSLKVGPSLQPKSLAGARRWKRPPMWHVKINVDGSFIANSGEAAIGIVACHHHGMVLDGLVIKRDPAQNPKSTEVMAFTYGIRFATENNWDRVIVERDVIPVVNRLANLHARYYLHNYKNLRGLEYTHISPKCQGILRQPRDK
ncbi:hypothetical protein F3Y22_tig00112131pilonHSYRG00117 [Hibiscus syriacus]|uniref:RNase H type-1 domain-containing protein n=1 Tax=Hibiscus syriacus TaxID=106335 RepID=A0A6A2X5Y4_HIBSY|nr:hypothetical protein F3Y22_tig00112131pilonHSYRG00117 [Hibiscus syriacus]